MAISDDEQRQLREAVLAHEMALLAAKRVELDSEALMVPVMYRERMSRDEVLADIFGREDAAPEDPAGAIPHE